jgi:hypothetical protein
MFKLKTIWTAHVMLIHAEIILYCQNNFSKDSIAIINNILPNAPHITNIPQVPLLSQCTLFIADISQYHPYTQNMSLSPKLSKYKY